MKDLCSRVRSGGIDEMTLGPEKQSKIQIWLLVIALI